MESNDGFKIAFCAILAFTALLDAVVAVFFYIKAKNKYEKYLSVDGTVVRVETEHGSKGPLVYPILRFKLGEKEYETKNAYGRNPWNIAPGTSVRIIYNMDEPNQAEIENKILQFLLPIAAGASAVMALALTVAMWFFVLT